MPWLLKAPPWATTPTLPGQQDTAASAAAGASTNRKRTADQITEAERALGKLASATGKLLMTHGWAYIVTTAQESSNIATTAGRVPHRAARLLGHLRQRGATVPVTTPAWPVERRDGAVKRGSHRSSEGERQFVSEEMLDFCAQGYWSWSHTAPYATCGIYGYHPSALSRSVIDAPG